MHDGDFNFFVDVDVFLVILWVLYVIVILLWVVSLWFVLNEEYYAWHILPSPTQLRGAASSNVGATCDDVQEEIEKYYFRVTLFPLIEQRFRERYGGDITNLILDCLNSIQITSTRCLIESLLDNLFGITIADISLDYHDN